MQKIWILASRELKTFFDSLIAYILLILFLGLSGFFTWILGADVFSINQVTMLPFFEVAYWSFFLFIPAITMKMFAEENKTGTIELLLTKSISDWQVVVAKFLAAFLLILIALLFTLPYYLTMSYLGDVDHGAVLSGYLGLLLMSASYIALGIWASSFTNNQIVAFLAALIIGFLFHLIFGLLSDVSSGLISHVFNYLSDRSHFSALTKGVIDLKDIIYFLSVTFLGLILTEAELAKRHIS